MAFTDTYQFVGPNTGYVPQYDEQARLIINYSRDWKKNKVNQLVTLVPVQREIGLYPKINPITKVNVTANYLQSRKWTDGQARPRDLLPTTQIEWLTYFTQRYCESEFIGYHQKDQAAFDLETVIINNLANRTVTARAVDFYANILQNANSYPANNTGTTTALAGGLWSAASSTNRYIQLSLMKGVEQIMAATGNGVKASDLILVVGPDVARQMAASGEIADYVGHMVLSPEYLQGTLFPEQLAQYGLPPMLYGIKVLVDDQVQATNSLGAAVSTQFVAGTNTAYLISRQGSLVGEAGGSNYSFCCQFTYSKEEMLIEVLDDVKNKRWILSVVDNRQFVATAPESGFLFTAVV